MFKMPSGKESITSLVSILPYETSTATSAFSLGTRPKRAIATSADLATASEPKKTNLIFWFDILFFTGYFSQILCGINKKYAPQMISFMLKYFREQTRTVPPKFLPQLVVCFHCNLIVAVHNTKHILHREASFLHRSFLSRTKVPMEEG